MIQFVIIFTTFIYAQNPFDLIKEINSFTPKFEKFNTIHKKRVIKKIKQKHFSKEIKLTLSAIFNNKAFINGKIVKVGETVFGYKLIRIKNKKVYLLKNGNLKILSIKPKFIKVSK